MPPPKYQVLLSDANKEQLINIVSRASERGQGKETEHARDKIMEGLTWLADELGERKGSVGTMGELRVFIIRPIEVVYAVDRANLVVRVGRFRLLENG
jgi:hypothetical protein